MSVLLAAACSSSGSATNRLEIARGAVASEHPLATEVGLEILARGGNAADAAVATAFALAVVYPQAGNLGGGGFALWVPAEGAARALDFREVAPASTLVGRYLDVNGNVVAERSVNGPLAVGVPGTPLGLFELHRECGSGLLSFADLVRPAERLAREGFAVDAWLAVHLLDEDHLPPWNEAALEVFYPDGVSLEEGALFVQPELADTLARLGRGGPDAFYTGGIASALVQELNGTQVPGLAEPSGGSIVLGDLANYTVEWRAPLHGWFLGHEVFSMPPPSSGGLVVMQSLAVLEGLPLESERTGVAGEVPTERMLHWWIEALRGSFADRAEHLGDPDAVDLPMQELLSPELAARRRAALGERANPDIAAWADPLPVESTETSHLSIVDRDGNALSMTTTLNGRFGSGIYVRDAGFLLNNQLDDFSIRAGTPNMYGLVGSDSNVIAAGKRPLSSMTPTVLRSPYGRPELVLGSPGGPRIITSVVQVLLRVLVLEQSLAEAVEAPRFHQQWRPVETLFEAEFQGGWDPQVIDALVQRGHPVLLIDERFGSVQAIAIDSAGEPRVHSDSRRGGAAGVVGGPISVPARPPVVVVEDHAADLPAPAPSRLKDAASVDLLAIEDFDVPQGCTEERWAELQKLAKDALDPAAGAAGRRAGKKLVEEGKFAIPAILNELKHVDLADDEQFLTANAANKTLTEICNGINLGWQYPDQEPNTWHYYDKQAILMWGRLWERFDGDDPYFRQMTKRSR